MIKRLSVLHGLSNNQHTHTQLSRGAAKQEKKKKKKDKLTSRCVPRNVAMKQPHARIIRFESDCDIAPGRYKYDISSRRIDKVESFVAVDWVKGCVLLSENYHVHAVPVKWVCN